MEDYKRYEKNTEETLLSHIHACHFALQMAHRKTPPFHCGQGRVLVILLHNQDMEQKILRKAMQIEAGSLSQLMLKMEKSELIIRTVDKQDKRSRIVRLTKEGYAEAMKISLASQEHIQHCFEALSQEERNQLCGILEKLLSSLRTMIKADDRV